MAARLLPLARQMKAVWRPLCHDVASKAAFSSNNSVGSRTAAADNMDAAIVAQVTLSGHLRTDAVICNWKELKNTYFALCGVVKKKARCSRIYKMRQNMPWAKKAFTNNLKFSLFCVSSFRSCFSLEMLSQKYSWKNK